MITIFCVRMISPTCFSPVVDGSITISETELDGLKDSVELEVAHSEMLVSAEVVEQVEQFLLHGEFKKSN